MSGFLSLAALDADGVYLTAFGIFVKKISIGIITYTADSTYIVAEFCCADSFINAFATGMDDRGGSGYGFSCVRKFLKIHVIIDINTAQRKNFLQTCIVRNIDRKGIVKVQWKFRGWNFFLFFERMNQCLY